MVLILIFFLNKHYSNRDVPLENIPRTTIENDSPDWIILQTNHHFVEIMTELQSDPI